MPSNMEEFGFFLSLPKQNLLLSMALSLFRMVGERCEVFANEAAFLKE